MLFTDVANLDCWSTIVDCPQVVTFQKRTGVSTNTKETLAILYGFHSFSNYFVNSLVLVQSDLSTVISYVCHFCSLQSELRTKIVTDLWTYEVDINSWISISYISGRLNCVADITLRVLNPRHEL